MSRIYGRCMSPSSAVPPGCVYRREQHADACSHALSVPPQQGHAQDIGGGGVRMRARSRSQSGTRASDMLSLARMRTAQCTQRSHGEERIPALCWRPQRAARITRPALRQSLQSDASHRPCQTQRLREFVAFNKGSEEPYMPRARPPLSPCCAAACPLCSSVCAAMRTQSPPKQGLPQCR